MAHEAEKDDSPLIAQLAFQIYGKHVHAGRAFASFDYALHGAAVIVGAAQSSVMMELIEKAKANPAKALAIAGVRA